MIQIERWSRSSDDVPWWSRSRDDLDLVMMIHIEWWSRSSDDVPDRVWSSDNVLDRVWSSDDDLDRVMIQIQMKMTWRWTWWELNNDTYYIEKNTCADKLCRENTFLVKRECWCNCNFGMYSLVFLIYCNLMFIPGFYCVMSCPDVPIERIYNVNKSCQVIVGNPPIF